MARAPQSETEARRWAKEAIRAKAYRAAQHFYTQAGARGFSLNDAINAIEHARSCEAYPALPEHGGSTWRISGPALDGTPKQKATPISVGIETYWDDQTGKRVLLVTIFNPMKAGGRK